MHSLLAVHARDSADHLSIKVNLAGACNLCAHRMHWPGQVGTEMIASRRAARLILARELQTAMLLLLLLPPPPPLWDVATGLQPTHVSSQLEQWYVGRVALAVMLVDILLFSARVASAPAGRCLFQ